MGVVISILAIGFLIFIHELGHLLVGRWTGLPAVRFSVGMGPVVFRRQAMGVEWAVSAIPFGGYVMFDGESEDWLKASPTAKILTSLAGPAVNIVAAGLLYVVASSIAAGAPAVAEGLQKTWAASAQMMDVLYMLFTGQVGINDLAGPVGMVAAGSSMSSDPTRFLSFMGFISLNLGILNLLPLPILDGGQIILTALRALRGGRDLPEYAEATLAWGSIALLVGVMVWVSGREIYQLVSRALA